MRPTTSDRDWTLSAPTLSPAELDTALALAIGDELVGFDSVDANGTTWIGCAVCNCAWPQHEEPGHARGCSEDRGAE